MSGPAGSGRGARGRLGLSAEAALFVRMATFGLVTGAAYGVLTREPAGVVLLVGFGVASGLVALALIVGSGLAPRDIGEPPDIGEPRDAGEPPPGAEAAAPDGSAGTAPVPTRPSWAPLGVAIGLGTVAVGAAFGPWLMIAGLFVAARSAWAWLAATIEDAAPRRRPGPPT